MRQLFLILVAIWLPVFGQAGVRPVGAKAVEGQQSAALFVGIRDFGPSGKLSPVPYAIDDAVDLAYEFAMAQQPPLVPPDQVVLALSEGEPRKRESRAKLSKLLAAGALRRRAQQAVILQLLDRQARRVGRNGILIVSLATHGVSASGAQHLLAEGSLAEHYETAISINTISEIVFGNDVARALILIDACRENLRRDRRAGEADARSRAAFIRVMTGVEGQVVITGAAAGGYAYDNDVRGNGVFTAAVIDALRCGAAKDHHGFVTVEKLYSYVSGQVLRWVRQNKNKRARRATQLFCEGQMGKMPLSICRVSRTASASPPRSD
ncbi:MAG: caspase family protein [Acidobacteriota bacterium]